MSVACIGEVVVDWLVAEPVENLDEARNFCRSLGGNASNVAIGLCRLGTAAKLIGKVGRDLHGHYLTEILRREGVDISQLLVDSLHPTAQCYVMTDADGDHTFYNWPQPHAADMLCLEELSFETLMGTEVVHATGISLIVDPRRSTVLRTIATAADNGLVVSFDACFPSGKDAHARRPVEEAMAMATIVKVNKRELTLWSGADPDSSIEQMAEALFSRYRPLAVAVTLGPSGSHIRTSSGAVDCRPFTVDAVNGVGAGDGFIAGLLHALNRRLGGQIAVDALKQLGREDWEQAGTFANAAGALATRSLSASESLPCQAEVSALMG